MNARVVLLAAVVLSTAACVPASARDEATGVARAFAAALSSGDGEQACALLAPETRHRLEQSEQASCDEAVLEQDVQGGEVGHVELFGDQAQVVLGGESAFLAEFNDGWKVVAAGCEERPKLPHDCQIEGA